MFSPERPTARAEHVQPVYTALFVNNIPQLLMDFPPVHSSRVLGHHSTIAFQPGSLQGVEVGAKRTMQIIARVHDKKGDALVVSGNPKSNNRYPHITLSCAEGVSPAYSNEMIQRAVEERTIEYFLPPYKEVFATEGYYDGKDDVTSL